MRMTSKGQVTIPIELREKANLLPNAEVDFELDGNAVRVFRSRRPSAASRGQVAVGRLRGRATVKMSTDAILALTRRPPRR